MLRSSVKYDTIRYDKIQKLINSGVFASNSHAARSFFDFYEKNKPKIEKLEKRNEYLKGLIYGKANRK